ncbi:hypothetical protein KBC75_01305 [Candidatus Shapirobacteria bacterium]|nr:hypothetical protein [Candidatus Shapirobacteria bacterium]
METTKGFRENYKHLFEGSQTSLPERSNNLECHFTPGGVTTCCENAGHEYLVEPMPQGRMGLTKLPTIIGFKGTCVPGCSSCRVTGNENMQDKFFRD